MTKLSSGPCRLGSTVASARSLRPSLYDRPYRFGICGAGPAGFYAASRLLSLEDSQRISVDLFERLPTPFGLSRYGVAPDHPNVKNCEHKFEDVAKDSRFRFVGNTQLIGQSAQRPSGSASLTLEALQESYDVAVLAYGAGLDRTLGGVPGEDSLSHILPARQVVNWYNGYPGDSSFVDLSQVEHVTIIGQGNVSLDIARILLTPVDVLAKTDISERALAELARSRVRHIDIVGRRGPLQVSFTTKEMREMAEMKDLRFDLDDSALSDAIKRANEPGVAENMSHGRMHKRLLDLMLKARKNASASRGPRSWSLKFLRSPCAFQGPPGGSTGSLNRVKSVEWQLNQLAYPPSNQLVNHSSLPVIPVNTKERITTPTDLVIKSLGYQSVPIDPIPLHHSKSCVPNSNGRVTGPDSQPLPGVYVAGWLSSGPVGVIANTMQNAFQTVNYIVADLANSPPCVRRPEIRIENPELSVSWSQWKLIDEEERKRGSQSGKPREKILSVDEMLRVAAGAKPIQGAP